CPLRARRRRQLADEGEQEHRDQDQDGEQSGGGPRDGRAGGLPCLVSPPLLSRVGVQESLRSQMAGAERRESKEPVDLDAPPRTLASAANGPLTVSREMPTQAGRARPGGASAGRAPPAAGH